MKLQSDIFEKEVLKKIRVQDILYFIVSITGIILLSVETIKINQVLETENLKITLYNTILILIIAILTLYGIISRLDAIKKKITVDRLKVNNESLLEVNDYVRCFKHDFNNIIQSIDGYIVLDDMDALKKYFKSLLKECKHMNDIDFINCQGKSNPAIYGVLLDKYKLAEKDNINMNIDVLDNLENYKGKAYVISRVIGILLDNAIEATRECEEKVVNIKFIKEENKNRNLIIIENTYTNKDIDTNKIFDKNYTTKQGNSGLGLWKIRDILSKDTSLDLYTSKNGIMFKQQFEIYN